MVHRMAAPEDLAPVEAGRRDLRALPKAHLHLHLTGGMRPATLLELAAERGIRLPAELHDPEGTRLDVTARRGWSRFQRLYDAARDVLRGPDDLRRLVLEIARTRRRPAAAGSRCRSTRRPTPRATAGCRAPSRCCWTPCAPPSRSPASAWGW
jgi:hypothetical protein